MTIGVIIQARTGSSRYPRKIYEDINGKTTLQRVIDGVESATMPNITVLAMPDYDKADLHNHEILFPSNNFKTYFGSENDVLNRYYEAARENRIDLIVRVTADCPLIQGEIIDEMLIEYLKNGYNGFMGSNSYVCSVPYPDGVDIEIFPYWMLVETHHLAQGNFHREHVCTFMYRRGTSYKCYEFQNVKPHTLISKKFMNMSFDTKEDLDLIRKISENYDKCCNLNEAIDKTSFRSREWKG